MKQKLTLAFFLLGLLTSVKLYAQQDSSVSIITSKESDTLRIGNIIIIKKHKQKTVWEPNGKVFDSTSTSVSVEKKPKKLKTNYLVVDIGLSTWNDGTDYAKTNYPASYLQGWKNGAPNSAVDFKLQGGKSINVNIWLVMQRYEFTKNLGIKYGLGFELNNYRLKSNISFKEGGNRPYGVTTQPIGAYAFGDTIKFSKNKLAADYLTVPVMLTFAAPSFKEKRRFTLGLGVSAGYLYAQRNKQISDERGKQKNKGDYDMERFKLSYVGEIGIGKYKIYASYASKSIFKRDLNLTPFNIGFRFSSF